MFLPNFIKIKSFLILAIILLLPVFVFADTCSDQCSYVGKLEYYQDKVRQCGNYDSDPCLEWSNYSTYSTCVDECSSLGEKEYANGKIRQCGNYDSDPCLEWNNWENYQESKTKDELSVSLKPSVSAGCAPLNGIGLTATVLGGEEGYFAFYFDCMNNGTWEKTLDSNSRVVPVDKLCNYWNPGIYTAKIRIVKLGVVAENTTTINAKNCGTAGIKVENLATNVSDGVYLRDSLPADPGELVSFQIKIINGVSSIKNAVVSDNLPSKMAYAGNLIIDGKSASGDIIKGINIGDLNSGQTKILSFNATIAEAKEFNFGQTKLINTVLVYSAGGSGSDSATVVVERKATLAVATSVSTGITNNLLVDSFFLPLAIGLLLVWIFKSGIIGVEEWIDGKKQKTEKYRFKKLLQLKISQAKIKEFLERRIP
ncbi:MAG: hypothetical protein Q8O39_00525 [bacterium]|nr:hypothetical protein [bacterium]